MKNGPLYQLKITLRGSRPPIWRRVLVPGSYSLAKLHQVIQIAMGWTGSHLHSFRIGDTSYSAPDPYSDWEDSEDLDSRRARLEKIAPDVKTKFVYEYDFGDGWTHDVLVEKTLPPDPALRHPVCLKGQRACPPEDVGGIWGYAEFLRAIGNPGHEEHDSYLEWIGGAFDPEAFDLGAVNAQLQRV